MFSTLLEFFSNSIALETKNEQELKIFNLQKLIRRDERLRFENYFRFENGSSFQEIMFIKYCVAFLNIYMNAISVRFLKSYKLRSTDDSYYLFI